MIVPDKTIAFYPVIPDPGIETFDMDINAFLNPLNKDHKRDWFTSNFYKCLPLSIGNMQGFVFSSPFSFDVYWNGGNSIEDITFTAYDDADKDYTKINHAHVRSSFGHGIFTFYLPVVLRTPPGVNLMTIAAPNYPLFGISAMTGVVESDNIKFTFSLNWKIDIPNQTIRINKHYPLAGIIPIPRYFCDSFELVNAYDIIDKDIIEEQRDEIYKMGLERNKQNNNGKKSRKNYYRGVDFYENNFKDHQIPKRNK
jgi:hypothetical protein